MVAMTASWMVPASGAQFPFGSYFTLFPLPSHLPLPCLMCSPCYTRAYVHAKLRAYMCLYTCTGIYTRLQSVPRSGGRASSGCPLQWAKPTGQPQPSPTSRSDDHSDCALSRRLTSLPSTLAFSL